MRLFSLTFAVDAHLALQFALAFSIDIAVVSILFPVLHWKSRGRNVLLCLLALASILSPCVIASGQTATRFIAALFTSAILVKIYDLAREAGADRVPSLTTYLQFITNSFWHVQRRRPIQRSLSNFRLLAMNVIVLAITLGIAVAIFRIDWARLPFALEHVAKVLACYAVLAPAGNGAAAAWRIAGLPAMTSMNHPELARTPADFWRRWNVPTAQFLYEDLFLPAGGLGHPIRGTLVVFGISAIMHEYVFGIAIGHVQGFQTCFFALQGLATLATLRWRPKGGRAAPAILLTLTFNLITARLFFASVAQIVPWYVPRVNS